VTCIIFRIRRSERYPSAHQPSLAPRPKTYLLQTGSYDVSIHPRHLSVLPTVVFHPRFRHDIQTTAVFYLTSHRLDVPPIRLSIVGKRAIPVSGATVWNDLPLHVASAPSLTVFRQPFRFYVLIKTLSYDSCVTINIHHCCLDTCGSCNN